MKTHRCSCCCAKTASDSISEHGGCLWSPLWILAIFPWGHPCPPFTFNLCFSFIYPSMKRSLGFLKSQYFWSGTRQMAGDRFGIHVRPTTDISYFSYYLDKICERNHWREKGFILAHSVSPSHWERQRDVVEFLVVRPCDGRVLLASWSWTGKQRAHIKTRSGGNLQGVEVNITSVSLTSDM